MKDSLRSSQPISWMVTCAVVATFIEQSPHKSVQKWSAELWGLHLTLFDHKRNLVMKSFWLVFVIELSDADMRLSQSMCFVVGMISGSLVSWESSLFRWMCSLLHLPILKSFLGLNRIFVTPLRCKTTHHTWWWCVWLPVLSLAYISLMELLVVLHVLNVELCYIRAKQQWDYVTAVISAK